MIDFRLYLVTDRKACAPRSLESVIEEAVAAGVHAVQLREKDLSFDELAALVERVRPVTEETDTHLIVNLPRGTPTAEDMEQAASLRADGVHFPVGLPGAREFSDRFPQLVVGASVRSADEAEAAAEAGADLVTFGPVFAASPNGSFGPPRGLGALEEVTISIGIPAFAIGGVTPDNAPDCIAAAAYGVAVVAAVMEADDVTAAVNAFRNSLGEL